jgi:hypothetical protein
MTVNRRDVLAYASAAALTGSGARAQPMPVVSSMVPQGMGAGPLPVGAPWGASLDLSFMVPGALDPRITFTRASTGTYFNSAGVMQTAAANAPRIEPRGLLIEEARTNLLFQSGDLSNTNYSSYQVATLTGNAVTSPDGALHGTQITTSGAPGGQYNGPANPVVQTNGAVQTASCFFKWISGPTTLELAVAGQASFGDANGDRTVLLNGQTGAFISKSVGVSSYSITSVGNGWWRVTGTFTPTVSNPNGAIAAYGTTAGTTFAVWGIQMEAGAFPTSYVPTTTASVTRSADLASMPTAAWFSATNGTYQAEFIPNGVASGLPIIIGGNAGSPTIATGADSRLTAGIRSGASVFSATGPLYTFGAVNKAAFAYLSGASNAAVNGTAFGPNAAAFTVTGTVVELGSDGVTPGANALNGWLRRARYWPRVLSNTEMQQVTT